MEIIQALILTLKAGFELLGTKEANKYMDQVIELEKKYYEEGKKPRPNMALLDDCERQLVVLSRTFVAAKTGRPPSPTAH